MSNNMKKDSSPKGIKEKFKMIPSKIEHIDDVTDDFFDKLLKHWQKTLSIICIVVFIPILLYLIIPNKIMVTVADGQEIITKECRTNGKTVEEVLEGLFVEIDENTLIYPATTSLVRYNTEIEIYKSFASSITADGETRDIITGNMKVLDILEKNGIQLEEGDIVTPERESILLEGEEIVIKRVTYENIVEEVYTPVEGIYERDDSIQMGQVVVTQEGVDAQTNNTYRARYEDGEYVSQTLVHKEMVSEGVPEIRKWGTHFGFQSPPPEDYVVKYERQRSTAYWLSGTWRGSYGGRCEYGTAAVDPNYIPLGSLIYVTGYGYAIANDVGSAVKGPMVDLWMDERDQMYMWGAQFVDIYVLRWGP